jgi:hypothetical protein
MQMKLAILLVVGMFPWSVMAFDPCFGARSIVNQAYQDSLNSQAKTQALSGGVIDGSPEFVKRFSAIRLIPSPQMLAQADLDAVQAWDALHACQQSIPHR